MFSAWRNNVHEIAGHDWRGFYPRACERKAVGRVLAARTYAPVVKLFARDIRLRLLYAACGFCRDYR